MAALGAVVHSAACAQLPSSGVSDTPAAAYSATVAAADGGLVVAWQDTRDGHAEIYRRRLDAAGLPIEPARRLTRSDSAWEPDAAAVNGSVVIGWHESTGPETVPKLAAWRLDGTLRWSRTLAAAGHSVVVSGRDATVAAAWIVNTLRGDAVIWVAWFDADGQPLGDAMRVGDAGRTTNQLRASLDDAGDLWLAYDTRLDNRADEVVLVRARRDQPAVRSQVTPDDGAASTYPDIGVEGGHVAITWIDARDGNQEVYLAVGSTAAGPADPGRSLRRVTNTPGDSIGPFLTWNGSRLGLAWCDDATGEQEIHLQTFDASGAALTASRRVTHTPWASLRPAIQASGDGFLLAWNEWDRAAIRAGHDDARRAQILAAVLKSEVLFRIR